MIRGQTSLESLLVIVASLDEGLTRDVVGHGSLGRVEDLVVRPARRRVDETAGDAGNEEAVVDLQLNRMHQLLLVRSEHLVQALGLGDGARESVENEA